MPKLLITTLLLFFVHQNIFAKELIIAADEWCPFNCDPDTDLPGYMVEVTKLAFELSGSGDTVTYIVLPWQRAMAMAKRNAIDGIIGATRIEAEGLHVPEQSLGVSDSVFFVPKYSQWTFDQVKNDEVPKVRIGTVKGYDHSPDFGAYTERNPDNLFYAYGEDPLVMLIRLLDKKKLDVVVEDAPVFWFKVKTLGLNSSMFKAAGSTGIPQNIYVAFYKKEYATALNSGIVKLRKSGQLKEILSKYNLQDWK